MFYIILDIVIIMARKKKIKEILKIPTKKTIKIELTPKQRPEEEKKAPKDDSDDVVETIDPKFFSQVSRRRIRMFNPTLSMNTDAAANTLEEELEDVPTANNTDNPPVMYNAPSYANAPSYSSNSVAYANATGNVNMDQDFGDRVINPAVNDQFSFTAWQNKNMDSDMMGTKNKDMSDNYAIAPDSTRFEEPANNNSPFRRRNGRPGY